MMTKEKKGIDSHLNDKTVFVSAVAQELSDYRQNLIKELEQAGCKVQEVAKVTGDSEQLQEILEDCNIAIHLLSDEDTMIDGIEKGIEEFQVQYSVQQYLSKKLVSDSGENGFTIYAWHPKPRAESIFDEAHIPSHLKKIQQLEEVELLRTNFEEFKYYLLDKVNSNEKPTDGDEFFIKGTNNINVLFLYDASDSDEAKEYIDYMKKRGFTVLTPMFDGDIMAARQLHNDHLKKFDVAIIFALKANNNWVNMKIMDILKSPGLGREKEIQGRAVFMPEEKAAVLQLSGRGFDFFPIDQFSLKEQVDEFLRRTNQ